MSLPFVVSVSSGLRKSLISSSHLFVGLPTALHVFILVLRPGFHLQLFHSSVCFDPAWDFGCIHPFFRFNCASFLVFNPVLLAQFLRCRSLHLYRLRRRRRCLGRNPCWSYFPTQFRLRSFWLLSFSSSLSPFSFSGCLPFSGSFPSLLFCVFFLYCLFVWTMSRCILRLVDRIILSRSFAMVQIPEAQLSVGEIPMLNKRSLYCARSKMLMSTPACTCERRPSSSNSTSDFCCLLLLKCNCISEILGTLAHWQYFDFDVVDRLLLLFCSSFDC